MSRKTDWLPRNSEALYSQSGQTAEYLAENLEKFGIVGKSAEWVNTEFMAKRKTFADAFREWKNPSTRTKTHIAALGDARRALEPAYREIYAFLKSNPNVANEDLVHMGLPERSDHKSTPVPTPASYPDLIVEPDGIRRVKLTFRDHGAASAAKPKGVGGAVMKWAILDAPPESVAELTHSALETKSPSVFAFDEKQRGKMLYVAAAWQNMRGEMGAYSEIENTIIP